MSAPLLAARDLAVGRRAPVLTGVTLAIAAGECWFVLGDNGAGKTTLLATLLGILPALGGTIERAPAIALRHGLGFVPQEPRFGRALPIAVAEFVAMGLPHGLARSERDQRVAAALATMAIADRARTPLAELSLGQRRRVLVARALARRPALLLLDEPTANLDPGAAAALCRAIERERAQSGLAIVHVAHALELARMFATHVARIADGGLRSGPASAMLDRAAAGGGA